MWYKSFERLKHFMWNVARSTYYTKLQHWLDETEKSYPSAKEWLNDIPYDQWSRACFKTIVTPN